MSAENKHPIWAEGSLKQQHNNEPPVHMEIKKNKKSYMKKKDKK